MKSKIENLVENLRGNKTLKSAERKKVEVKKVGRKNSVDWNHTDSILNWDQKDSDSIHVDMNHTNSNKPIPSDSKNIGLIYDSDDILTIENILASPVHSPVHASPIFTYGAASDPPSPPHNSSA